MELIIQSFGYNVKRFTIEYSRGVLLLTGAEIIPLEPDPVKLGISEFFEEFIRLRAAIGF
jgi:hypothetical protein